MSLKDNLAAFAGLPTEADIAALFEAVETTRGAAIMQEATNLFRQRSIVMTSDWRRVDEDEGLIITDEEMRNQTTRARLASLLSPVIIAGLVARRLLVFGQGMRIATHEEEVTVVIDDFMSINKAILSTIVAQTELEETLSTDGNLFIRLFPDGTSGRVRARLIDRMEIDEILCNPEDKTEAWFYKRSYRTRRFVDGKLKWESITEWYPDIDLVRTDELPVANISGIKINWDTPVYHTAVNRPRGTRFGLCEYLSALPWAKGYEVFLENRATLYAAYAAIAMLAKVKADRIKSTRDKLVRNLADGRDDTSLVKGSTAVMSHQDTLEPVGTKGATTPPSEGIQFLEMVMMVFTMPPAIYGKSEAGGIGINKERHRILWLSITARQTMWSDIYGRLFDYAKLWGVKASEGKLKDKGKIEPDPLLKRERVVWQDDYDPRAVAVFPPIIEQDATAALSNLIDATTLKGQQPTGIISPRLFLQQTADFLKISGLEALLDELPDVWPTRPGEVDAFAEAIELVAANLAEAQ